MECTQVSFLYFSGCKVYRLGLGYPWPFLFVLLFVAQLFTIILLSSMLPKKNHIRVPKVDPRNVDNHGIRFPLYVKQEFTGPYGTGTSFRPVDITDIVIGTHNDQVNYIPTNERIELYIKLSRTHVINGHKTSYLSLGKYGYLTHNTHMRIMKSLKI
jgi:hypothetical protein